MKKALLFLVFLFGTVAWSQPLYVGVVSGTVIDSASGNAIANHPVILMDSTSNAITQTYTLYTDSLGFFMDSVGLMGQSGTLFISTFDSCSNQYVTAYMYYGPTLTPSNFSFSTTFSICNGSSGGSGGGGSTPLGNCEATFIVDSNLTTNGTIVLYNTSSVDSIYQGLPVQFVWDFGDSSTSTGAYPTHQYNSPGTFIICLTQYVMDSTALGGLAPICSTTHCDTISIDSTGNVSLKDFVVTLNVYSPAVMSVPETDLWSKLYPNPSRGSARLLLNQPSNVALYNSLGQIILQERHTKDLNISVSESGIYTIVIEKNGQIKTLKWSKL